MRRREKGSTPASHNLSKGYRRYLESTVNRGPTPDEQKLFNKWDKEFAKRKVDVVTIATTSVRSLRGVDDLEDGMYLV